MFFSAFCSEFTFAVTTGVMAALSQPLSSFASSMIGWTIIGMVVFSLAFSWACVIIQQFRNWKRSEILRARKELREKELAERRAKREKEDKQEKIEQVIYYKHSLDNSTALESERKQKLEVRTEKKPVEDQVIYFVRGNKSNSTMMKNENAAGHETYRGDNKGKISNNTNANRTGNVVNSNIVYTNFSKE